METEDGVSWSMVDLWFPGETDRAKDLERRNQELNQKKLERGQVTREWVDAQQERFNSTGPSTFNSQVLDAAGEGAVEGIKAMPAKVRDALTTGAGWSLSFIPWWGWLIGAGVVWGYLGGWSYLRGILARR